MWRAHSPAKRAGVDGAGRQVCFAFAWRTMQNHSLDWVRVDLLLRHAVCLSGGILATAEKRPDLS